MQIQTPELPKKKKKKTRKKEATQSERSPLVD
jgi:hypothetical protein